MHSPKHTATLAEVLSDRVPYPWNLHNFIRYLIANHCIENFYFLKDASEYREHYRRAAKNTTHGPQALREWAYVRHVWESYLDTYLVPNGDYEVNLPHSIKTRLLATRHAGIPPHPSALNAATQTIHNLIEDSILPGFLNSADAASPLIGTVNQKRKHTLWRMYSLCGNK